MTTTTTPRSECSPVAVRPGPARIAVRAVIAGAIALSVAIAMGIGLPGGPETSERTAVGFLYGADGDVRAEGDGDFVFFTFRRNVWVFRKSTMTVKFYNLPEASERAQEAEESRVYQIDARDFPLADIQFQVSERNLTNYLWLLNPKTGKARILKARRDGLVEESLLLDANRGS